MNQPGFAADIADEPAVLERVAATYADASMLRAVPRRRRVLLAGMGSSMYAAQVTAIRLRAHGLDAYAELASTAAPTPPAPDLLCIAISASGGSAETLELLERHAGTSATVAVTNAPHRLAGRADLVLPLAAGPELGGISCKTFCATLAVLDLVAAHLVDTTPELDIIRRAADAAGRVLEDAGTWLEEVADRVGRAATIYTVAPVERLSSALEAALMFREGPRLAADACETGDWLHVDVYLTKQPGYTALLFPGSRYDDALMTWMRERRATVVAIGSPVDGAGMIVPIAAAREPRVALLIETLAAELVANEQWRRRITAGAMP